MMATRFRVTELGTPGNLEIVEKVFMATTLTRIRTIPTQLPTGGQLPITLTLPLTSHSQLVVAESVMDPMSGFADASAASFIAAKFWVSATLPDPTIAP
ncbi:MAG: hypothetical protein ABR582_15885 [Gemmatimonadaceae bacterium]